MEGFVFFAVVVVVCFVCFLLTNITFLVCVALRLWKSSAVTMSGGVQGVEAEVPSFDGNPAYRVSLSVDLEACSSSPCLKSNTKFCVCFSFGVCCRGSRACNFILGR